MNRYAVAVPSILNHPLTYHTDEIIPVGQLVRIKVRNKLSLGAVWKIDEGFIGITKPIIEILPINIGNAMCSFLTKFADYNLIPLGVLIKHLLNADIIEKIKNVDDKLVWETNPALVQLSVDQNLAANFLNQALGRFQTILLHGVTGSGKTEVFLNTVQKVLVKKQQTLILMPEIALTTNFVQRFTKQMGVKPLIWHSQITKAQKMKIWQFLQHNLPVVIVGTRSALLLPLQNLGLIIVDEEHDSSYKQEEQFFYNARDMAVLRAKIHNVPIILSSATPSLETIQNVYSGLYQKITLPNRFGDAQLPNIRIIDQKGQNSLITKELKTAIEQCLEKQEQVLLFFNRRGYATLVLCKACGHIVTCKNCAVYLVPHQLTGRLHCHYCDYHTSFPTFCPQCQQTECLKYHGVGAEKIYDIVSNLFPKAKVCLATSDIVQTAKQAECLINDFLERKIDIIVGTQILAKGHHFPYLTLVGIIDADSGLNSYDLRANEKNLQILNQVAGRCGRAERVGQVLIQTYNPEHPMIKALSIHDLEGFINIELKERQIRSMPPFGRLAGVIFISPIDKIAEEAAWQFIRAITPHPKLQALGPIPAPLHFLRNKYRWRILLKYSKDFAVQNWYRWLLPQINLSTKVKVQIDIDPISFV